MFCFLWIFFSDKRLFGLSWEGFRIIRNFVHCCVIACLLPNCVFYVSSVFYQQIYLKVTIIHYHHFVFILIIFILFSLLTYRYLSNILLSALLHFIHNFINDNLSLLSLNWYQSIDLSLIQHGRDFEILAKKHLATQKSQTRVSALTPE